MSTGSRSADKQKLRRKIEQLKEDYSNGTVQVNDFNRLRKMYLKQLQQLVSSANPASRRRSQPHHVMHDRQEKSF